MATPHVVPKVPLKYCTSEFHSESKCVRPDIEDSVYEEQCRYWCPICDDRSMTKPFRRRSKSECVETDPLRERNRVCSIQPSRDEYDRSYHLSVAGNKLLDNVKEEQVDYVSRSMDVDTSLNHYVYEIQKPQKYDYDINIPQIKADSGTTEYSGHRFCENDITDVSYKRHQFLSVDGKNNFSRKKVHNCNETLLKGLEYSSEKAGRRLPVVSSVSNHRQNLSIATSHEVNFPISEMQSKIFTIPKKESSFKGIIRPLGHEDMSEGKRPRQRCESDSASQLNGNEGLETIPLWAKRPRDDLSTSHTNSHFIGQQSCLSKELLPTMTYNGALPAPKLHHSQNLVVEKQNLQPVFSSSSLQNGLSAKSLKSWNRDGTGSISSIYSSSIECDQISDSGESKFEVAEDSEEDSLSVLSSLTSFSSDPNTPLSINSDVIVDVGDAVVVSEDKVTVLPPYLRASLFSYVPPYIRFLTQEQKEGNVIPEIQRHLKWKLSTITPLVVRRSVLNAGYKLVRKSDEWCGMWGKHMKSVCFNTLKDFQKFNHFPGTFQLGRKDRLWKNLYRLRIKFGKKEFGFIPRTYVLPQDMKLLRQSWERGGEQNMWIIKPPASSRGTGIKVIHRWTQIPKRRPLIVQKYVSKPYLINGSKFDLRLYILVTSINPLRIYMYDDGLVRFASVKYSSDLDSLHDSFIHLTNYSINKLSSHYTHNEDASACRGHKWTVKTLWTYLEGQGVNTKALWNRMVDLCIKTVISAESAIVKLTRTNLGCRYNSYELFGIDILLDSQLKPWLLEVNISPSLHSSSPLDVAVKDPLVHCLMNLAGYQIPNKFSASQQEEVLTKMGLKGSGVSLCFDKRLYTTVLSTDEMSKHSTHEEYITRDDYLESILEELTADDVRHLIQSEDELTQAKGFVRIFPTVDTHTYHQFFESPRYYNFLLDAWEHHYHKNRKAGIERLEKLCKRRRHLEVPVTQPVTKASAELSPNLPDEPTTSLNKDSGKSLMTVGEKKPPVVLYRAIRPRSGKSGIVFRPFSRAVHTIRRLRTPNSPVKDTAKTVDTPKPIKNCVANELNKFPKQLNDKMACKTDLHTESLASCGIEVHC